MRAAVPTTTPREPVKLQRTGRAGRPPNSGKYPFDKLEVGQSFFVPNELLPKSGADGVIHMAREWARRRGLAHHPFKSETFQMGVRITRVAVGDERGDQTHKYPWGRLRVGESFFVANEFAPKRGITDLHTALYLWRRLRPEERAGIRYSGKTLTGGVLMTRIA